MALIVITENTNGKGVEITTNQAPVDYSNAVVNKTHVLRIVQDNGVEIHFTDREKFVFQFEAIDQVGTNTDISNNDVLYNELKKIAGLD